MKNNYTKNSLKTVLLILLMIAPNMMNGQNIKFTFEDAQNTNDGVDDYLEADIMMQTVDGMTDFLLGSGQMYFNYNTAAFGLNAEATGNFVLSFPDDQGYMLAEYYNNFGKSYAYGPHVYTDNTSSRISIFFGQAQSSFVMTASSIDAMVTATPRKLFHIKMKYEDFSQPAQVVFEDNEDQLNGGVNDCRDQFFTAAGSSTTPTLDLGGEPGTQLQDALFVSTGISAQVLATDNFEQSITNISLYPNPSTDVFYIKGLQEATTITINDINGKEIRKIKNYLNESIDISRFNAGVYLIKIANDKTTKIEKFIKK